MLTNTLSLVGTTVVTSGTGFAYWWVAARQYTPEGVGLASAAVSTMMLLGSISMLGLGTLLITELPRQPKNQVSLISTGVAIVGIVGVLIGVGFACLAPLFSAQFAPLRASILDVLLMGLGVGFTAATSVLDQALVGILRGNVQFTRNAFFATSKLILLFLVGAFLSYKTGMTIYATWVAGIVFSFVLVFIYSLVKRGWQGRGYLPRWNLLSKLGPAALQHHMLNLTLQVPTQLLPILVTLLLSAKMNAWFYVSWMIASFLFLVPMSFTSVLHAMNSAEQSSLKQKARTTVGVSMLFCLLAGSVLFIATKQVLGVFGAVYADQATWCLRILVLAGFTCVIRAHYISFCRIRDRISQAMFGMIFGGMLELGGAILGAHLGNLIGLCVGWVVATAVEAAFMFPVIYSVLWPAKGAVEEQLPANFGESEPIWLLDTYMMAAVPPRHTTGHLRAIPRPVHLPEQPVWQAETTLLPITPARSVKPVWQVETSLQPAVSSAVPVWLSDTLVQPAVRPSRQQQGPITPLPIERENTVELVHGGEPAGQAPFSQSNLRKTRIKKSQLKDFKDL